MSQFKQQYFQITSINFSWKFGLFPLIISVFLILTTAIRENAIPNELCEADCQAQEETGLMAIYNSTGGSNWTYPELRIPFRQWGTYGQCIQRNEEMPAHCCWEGVCCCMQQGGDTCDLWLFYQQLPLDTANVDLGEVDLVSLNASLSTGLTDSTPEEKIVKELTGIQESGGVTCLANRTRAILLSQFNLRGSIPDQNWGERLPQLDFISMSRNGLNSNIPESIFNLTNMRMLAMDRNYLTGTLSEAISQMKGLQAISLQSNELNGTLPRSLFQMPDLNVVYLGFNKFTGTIPNLVRNDGTRVNMTALEIQSNNLHGEFPIAKDLTSILAAVYGSYQLTYLNIRNNNISGTLPEVVGIALPKLVEFDVGENRLTGVLPQSLGQMYSLRRLSLDHNKLSGYLPSFGESIVLRDLFLGDNAFNGTIPPQLFQLGIEQLDLSRNRFQGTLPDYTGSNLLFRLVNVGQNPWLSAFSFADGEPVQNNSCHEQLPPFLKFQVSSALVTQPVLNRDVNSALGMAESQEIMCPLVLLDNGKTYQCRTADNEQMSNTMPRSDYSRLVTISPRYYGYKFCQCPNGLDIEWVENKNIPYRRDMVCRPRKQTEQQNGWGVALYIVVVVVIFCVGFCCASWRFRAQLSENILLMRKRNGPPNAGNYATVVVTDIEGSTALTDHHSYAMQKALNIHDSLMRRIRWQHAGYESNTEGDSFTIVFHEAMDALAFCLQVQQALLKVEWDEKLLDNEYASEKFSEGKGLQRGDSFKSGAKQGPKKARRLSYDSFVSLTKAFRRTHPSSSKFNQSSSCSIYALEAIKENPPITQKIDNDIELELATVHSNSSRSWYEESHAAVRIHDSGRSLSDARVLFKGLRVRMAVATGTISSRSVNRLTGRVDIQGTVMDKANSIGDIPQGGQIIMDQETFQAVNGRLDELGTVDQNGFNQKKIPSAIVRQRRRKMSASNKNVFTSFRSFRNMSTSASLPSIKYMERSLKKQQERAKGYFQSCKQFCRTKVLGIVNEEDEEELEYLKSESSQAKIISLGGFRLNKLDDGQSVVRLLEIYSPNLLQRSQYFRDAFLATEGRVLPSFYEAPGVGDIKVGVNNLPAFMPQVVLGFCAIEHIKSLSFLSMEKELGDQFYNQVMDLINYCLRKTRGYLCQDSIDTFMLAFASPDDAVQFSLLLQDIMTKQSWPEKIIKTDGFRQEFTRDGQLLFNGPRVKLGLYEGMPTQIIPHTTTGRADYFGPLVNRAARFCHAGAHGGQIVLTREMMQHILSSWNISNVSLESLIKIKAKTMPCGTDSLSQPVISRVYPDPLQESDVKSVAYAFDENQFVQSNSSRSSEINGSSFKGFGYSANQEDQQYHHHQLQQQQQQQQQQYQDQQQQREQPQQQYQQFKENEEQNKGDNEDEEENNIDEDHNFEFVEIHDMGSYEFRGCDGQYQLVYLVSERMSQRRFPYGLAKAKGRCTKAGAGFLCKVRAPINFEDFEG